jgi:sugar (pentulose or hexulose) kinase
VAEQDLDGGAAPAEQQDARAALGGHRTSLSREVTEPARERSKVYGELYETYLSLYPATKKAMSRLTELATGR